MQNAIVRGLSPVPYTVCYGGSENLSESIPPVALTGTVAFSANVAVNGVTTVTGTGTAFTTELHLGQSLVAVNPGGSESAYLTVESVISDTSCTVSGNLPFTASGLTASRMARMFAVDDKRGTSLSGNVIKTDKGSLFSAGSGTYRENGQTISASLVLTRSPQISLFDATVGTYTNFPLGMDTPAPPTLAAVSGGSLGMQAGSYSMVITAARTETGGYNNPSDRADVTIADDDQVEVTFGAMDTANGQNAWIVWVTTYAASLGADKNYLEGPWFKLRLLTTADVPTGGGVINLEWLDAQVERNDLITFDNDPPSDAEFVMNFNNVPVYISCQGPGSTSPGPFIIPAKPDNIEAAPLTLAFSSSPPETIYGFVLAEGRLYLLTSNHLQIAQGTPQPDIPVLIQPFSKPGFKNPDQVIVLGDRLYMYPTSGPTRAREGVAGSATDDFATAVQEITSDWVPGHVRLAHDPSNDAVCWIHSANNLNDDGFWTTRILMFGRKQDDWIGDVLLSSSTGDMIVSGVATVGQSLNFLAGGRQSDNSVAVGTFTFDVVSGDPVEWYAAAQISDSGDEMRSVVVKRPRATAKTTDGSLGIFGWQPTQVIDVDALESGNAASLTGAVSIPNAAGVVETEQFPVNCPNLTSSTIRIQGEFAGSGDRDRVDELIYEVAQMGIRR